MDIQVFLFFEGGRAAIFNNLNLQMFVEILLTRTTMFIDQMQAQWIVVACFINVLIIVQKFIKVPAKKNRKIEKKSKNTNKI